MISSEYSNVHLVTLAVAHLGGHRDFVDREDVANYVNALAPGRFVWLKYPENIDIEAVSVALRDARKPRYGSLLVGGNKQGWMLTPKGLKWVSQHSLEHKDIHLLAKERKNSVMAVQELETARLRTTRAYDLFASGKINLITIQDFYQFARINEYFLSKAREKRFAILDNAVSNDEVLEPLWRTLKDMFAEEIK